MRTRWLSRRAVGLHVTVVVVVGACLGLGWWQLNRALGGNSLSWVYTFEWPFFAVYGIYMWWKLVHEEDSPRRQGTEPVPTAAAPPPVTIAERVDTLGFDPYDDDEDPELAAYNRYLANLHLADHAGRKKASKDSREQVNQARSGS